jgi:hypothetical protein
MFILLALLPLLMIKNSLFVVIIITIIIIINLFLQKGLSEIITIV